MAITLIVGTILVSITLFQMAKSVKLRNKMLFQSSRPYLVCLRNQQQLEIRNIGQIPIKLDQLIIDQETIPLDGKIIPIGQSFFYNIGPNSAINALIKYHDDIGQYENNFPL
ncbi:hypothetical protein [Companilactobacillus halodurans]|uniref:Uncharacterized protein n=1 Tax=Companilactobacillus halodurans TaxID=2584183 RepID=A0A5P0ZWU4_9LACO|nr:hypothetical protein [Companilactobacillus halodurans]MQS97563.1 hypothetical protein [Companilactobacillus halodurans]